MKKGFKHEWIAKAIWRSTALKFHVEADNEKTALLKAEGRVFRMEGGIHCLEIRLIQQIR